MDIEFSQEDLDFEKEVQDFIENKLPKGMDLWTKRGEWFEALRKKGGWDVSKWPVEFGGPGFTPTQRYIFDNEMAKNSTPPQLPFGVGMLAPILMNYGSKEQQDRFLPGIRDSSVNWCQGYSEPGAGSDLANLKTKAELTEDGKHYIVNGQKIWTTLAHIAHWMFCLVRTSSTGVKQEGITFLLIPMDDPGIEVKPIITLGGSHTVNEVYITDVKVPVENRIGEEGKGWTYAKGLLIHERTGLAGIQNSVLALEKAKENASSIKVGDGTLLDVPVFKNKIGALEAELLALEFTELRSLAQVSAGGDPGPESSIMKLKGTEIQQRISELTLESSGIYAAAWGNPVGPAFAKGATSGYLGARATTIYGGASEVQKDVISKNVLGLG
ncbi:MAG TPA: acyl-CoA dehydrogenase family protein [Pseudomonadales bacterium]|nr:acyl-CoA dehydrogenase family protein [Pseudomonadales bacterium]